MRTIIPVALCALFMIGGADAHSSSKQKSHAALHAAKSWAREPATFMSLPLGGPMLGDSQKCPLLPDGQLRAVSTTPARPCWSGESNVKNFYNLPSPGFPDRWRSRRDV